MQHNRNSWVWLWNDGCVRACCAAGAGGCAGRGAGAPPRWRRTSSTTARCARRASTSSTRRATSTCRRPPATASRRVRGIGPELACEAVFTKSIPSKDDARPLLFWSVSGGRSCQWLAIKHWFNSITVPPERSGSTHQSCRIYLIFFNCSLFHVCRRARQLLTPRSALRRARSAWTASSASLLTRSTGAQP